MELNFTKVSCYSSQADADGKNFQWDSERDFTSLITLPNNINSLRSCLKFSYSLNDSEQNFIPRQDFLHGRAQLNLKIPIYLGVYNSGNVGKTRSFEIIVTDQGPTNFNERGPFGNIYGSVNHSIDMKPYENSFIDLNVELSKIQSYNSDFYIYIEETKAESNGGVVFLRRDNLSAILEFNSIRECFWLPERSIDIDLSQPYIKREGSSNEFFWEKAYGIDNDVIGYRITWFQNIASNKKLQLGQVTLSNSEAINSYVINNIGKLCIRGFDLYVDIEAIGATDDERYKYSSPLTGCIGRINTLPVLVPFIAYNIIPSNGVVKFDLSIKDEDNINPFSSVSQHQQLAAYYSLDDGEKRKISEGLDSYKKVQLNASDLKSGKHSVKFFVDDSLEEVVKEMEFTINEKPTISIDKIFYKELEGYSETILATDCEIFYKVTTIQNNNNEKIQFKIKKISTGEEKQYEDASFSLNNFQSKTIRIFLSSDDSSFIKPGDEYQYSLKFYDGVEWSDYSEFSTVARYPNLPAMQNRISIIGNADREIVDEISLEKFFSLGINIKMDLSEPLFNSGLLKLSKIKVSGTYQAIDEEKIYEIKEKIISVSWTERKDPQFIYIPLDGLGKETKNYLFNIKITTTDIGSYFSIDNFEVVLTRVVLNEFTKEDELSKSLEEIRPLSIKPMSDLVLSHRLITNKNFPNFPIEYGYSIIINQRQEQIPATLSDNGDTVIANINAEDLKTVLSQLAEPESLNKNYEAIWVAEAKDIFGNSTSISTNIKVAFQEKPLYTEEQTFSIYHGYDISAPNNSATEVSDLNSRMFNPGEGIIFKFPGALDPNGKEDIVKYNIYLSRQDLVSNGQNEIDIKNAKYSTSPLLQLSLKDLSFDNNTELYSYCYKASSYIKNEIFCFKICAVDSTNLESNPIYSKTYIIGCRTVQPQFLVEKYDIILNEEEDLRVAASINIKDLGGSALDSWSENYYRQYQNFERIITGYSPKIGLKVEVSLNNDFEDAFIGYFISEHDFLSFDENKIIVSFDGLTRAKLINTKLFIRFSLIISTGLHGQNFESNFQGLNTISNISQIYIYSGNVPTIAYRPHRIGINMDDNFFGENDLLTISSFNGSNYSNHLIRLLGNTTEGENMEIVLNLNTGQIDGIKINCGNWDEI